MAKRPRTKLPGDIIPGALNLELECPECLGHRDVRATDPRCPACKGTGYVPTPRGKELLRFLARNAITPGIPTVMPPGRLPEAEPEPRIPPPPAALKEGDQTTFRGRRAVIVSANYQYDAEPHGWVYQLHGIPGLVAEKELLGVPETGVELGEPEQAPAEGEGGGE